MRLKESTLYRKILALLLVSVYIPVLLLGYFSYHMFSVKLDNATAAFLLDHLQNNARRLQELLGAVEQHSVSVYSSDKLQKLLRDDAAGLVQGYEFLNETDQLRSELGGPYYLNLFGNNLDRFANYDFLKMNAPQLSTGWFERAKGEEGQGFWLHEFHSEFGVDYSDFYYVRAVRSLYPADFRNLGVLTIRIPSSQMKNALVTTERYPHYRIMLVDPSGRDLLQQAETEVEISAVTSHLTKTEEELFRRVDTGKQSLYAASLGIGYNDWRLVATIPAEDVAGPVRQMKIYIWGFVLVSLLLITILLAWIANRFTGPIRRIAGHMKKVQMGNLAHYNEDAFRGDEIGQLSRGYDSMIGGMKELLAATRQTEAEKRELELQILMQQINPHFLYNTLDTIKWKADMAEQPGIANMVRALADLLRFSLNEGKEMTTLERELEHVKTYIGIEQMRKGTFQVLFNVRPGLGKLPFMKLILQPIVENAIRHGIRPLSAGEGKLVISVYKEGDDIVCTVEDNGRGCSDEIFSRLNRIGTGIEPDGTRTIGLPNVSRRLRRAFGDRYGLTFERTSGAGLRVIIRHPALPPETP